MPAVCFYFHVHQPKRLNPEFSVFDLASERTYFSDDFAGSQGNRRVIAKVAEKCYLPANATFLAMLERYPELKLSFSITGVFLEQLEAWAPEVLESFQALIATGRVELVTETYYHSLAFLHSEQEFREQIELQQQKLQAVFGVKPRIFRNTELIYNNHLARIVADMGFVGMLTEGADHILGWRSPNYLYQAWQTELPLLLKNYKLSDDIAFRFSEQGWVDFPLSAEKFAHWVSGINGSGDVVNLFIDYETFGEHQWEDTGIFEFLRALPEFLQKHPDNEFVTPSEALRRFPIRAELDVHNYISWADVERDLSAWRSNAMQEQALQAVYALEEMVKGSGDEGLLHAWRLLQTSDHFYYMCTKWFNDGDVHKYFSPYASPHEAFVNFMTVLADLRGRVGV